MLNVATGYSNTTQSCSELNGDHAGEGFRSLRHIRRYGRVNPRLLYYKGLFSREIEPPP